jgi:hypothetical protein
MCQDFENCGRSLIMNEFYLDAGERPFVPRIGNRYHTNYSQGVKEPCFMNEAKRVPIIYQIDTVDSKQPKQTLIPPENISYLLQ